MRIVLVEAGPEVFSMFKPDIRAYTEKALKERTVEVMTGETVASVSPTRVTLKSGAVLDAHTLVWGAGLQGNRLGSRSDWSWYVEIASPLIRISRFRGIPRCTSSVT